MASVTDVLNALVAVFAQTMYPNGTASLLSAAGVQLKIYGGWPNSATLDADLAAGTCHISAWPRPEETNTTRFPKDWTQVSLATKTVTATIAGNTLTIGGTVSTPQNVMVLCNNKPYVYAVQATDTLNSIATGLAALVNVGVPGTSSTGSVITFPTNAVLEVARIGVSGVLIRETRRQAKRFQITVWADSPTNRDAVANPIDVALSDIEFLTLADGFAARLIYFGQFETDDVQKQLLYRRDFLYTIEYATIETTGATSITQTQLNESLIVSGLADSQPIGNLTTYQ